MRKRTDRIQGLAVLLLASLLCVGGTDAYGGELNEPVASSSECPKQSLPAEQAEDEDPGNAVEELTAVLGAEPEILSQAGADLAGTAPQADPIAAPLADVLRQTRDYILATDPEPDQESQWNAIGLARSGLMPEDYRKKFYENTAAYVKEKDGILHKVKYTEYSKMILSMTAIGRDARDIGGYDLLEKLADLDKVKIQGINGPIWALIALRVHPDYGIPVVDGVGEQTTEEGLIAHLLQMELPGGGWCLQGDQPEVDITAMALQALAPYHQIPGREDVTAAIDRALEWLSQIQMDDGGYATMGTPNAESTCQVLTALSALGIDCGQDSRFIKDGRWIVNALLSYRKDGGFMHIKDGAAGNGGAAAGQVNGMATEQAFYALTSYQRLLNGQSALYDMSDVDLSPGQEVTPQPEQPIELKGSLKLKASKAAASSVRLRWNKITGAAGYRVYRYAASARRYERIATLGADKTVYTCKDLTAGTTYRFRVAAYINEGGSAVDKKKENVTVSTRPAKPTIKAVRKTAKKVTVSWSRVNGSSGYEIYMSAKKNSGYKKIKTVTGGKKGSYIKGGLKAGKTYHFKVRAYRKVNGQKIYGGYSAIKTVRPLKKR